jgi:hypothetical protein
LGQIRLVLDADKEGMATFDLSFLVTNAGWTPEYDLRLVDVNSPLSLTFKARVWQKTGVDWTGVKLSLTNAQPSLSQLKPELNPWYLSQYAPTRPKVNLSSYAQTAVQNGMVSGVVVDETSAPLPGVTVMVTGTTHGTVTDFDGRFSIELPQGSKQLTVQFIGCVSQTVTVNGTYVNVMLQPDVANLEEVVVVGYGVQKKSLFSRRDKKVREEVTDSVSSVTAEQEEDMQQRFVPNQMVENLTNVRYDIETPYSVASDGKSFTVDITKVEVKANYMYVAVPKLDTDAFLTATVPQWSDYQLLDGQANIYFEGTYMGQSMIESNFITDTLQLGIGRDKSIVVKRDKLKDLSSKSFFGSKRTVERGFEISVRNTKKIPIEIVIEDQYPVTSNEAVKVEHIDHSGAELVGSTGKLKWVLKLQPGEVVKRNLKYSVEFPTKLNLYVE